MAAAAALFCPTGARARDIGDCIILSCKPVTCGYDERFVSDSEVRRMPRSDA